VALLISHYWLEQINRAATAAYPLECCGLLLGHRLALAEERSGQGGDRQVVDVAPAENRWDASLQGVTDPTLAVPDGETRHLDRHRRFWIDPEMMLKVQRQARDLNLDIIGIYHSHPEHPAWPSECDRRLAWPVYSYVIVSVTAGQVADCRSWQLDDQHQFRPEAIKIVDKI